MTRPIADPGRGEATRLFVLLASLLVVVAAALPRGAYAFHAGQSFSDPPGAGGGGGIFYLGTPKERGWDCSMCHQGAPKRMRVRLTSDPPELFEQFQYQPGGVRYAVTVSMEFAAGADELGVGSPGNTNSLSATFEDDEGMASGLATGVADDWTITNGATLTSKGTKSGVRSFTFNWFSPDAASAKPTTLYLGLVDGNGGAAMDTFQDPLNDDVFMTHIRFTPLGAAPASTGQAAHDGGGLRPPNLVRTPSPAISAVTPRALGAHEPSRTIPWSATAPLPIAAAAALVAVGFLQRRKKRQE